MFHQGLAFAFPISTTPSTTHCRSLTIALRSDLTYAAGRRMGRARPDPLGGRSDARLTASISTLGGLVRATAVDSRAFL